jgi:hypothetical protein
MRDLTEGAVEIEGLAQSESMSTIQDWLPMYQSQTSIVTVSARKLN